MLENALFVLEVLTWFGGWGGLLAFLILWSIVWMDHRSADLGKPRGRASFREFIEWHNRIGWATIDSSMCEIGSGDSSLRRDRFMFNGVYMILGPIAFLLANHLVENKIRKVRKQYGVNRPFSAVMAQRVLTDDKR